YIAGRARLVGPWRPPALKLMHKFPIATCRTCNRLHHGLCNFAATQPAPRKRRAIAYEQAVPQTGAAKRHYAGGSCRGGTGIPKKRGCVFWGALQTRPRSAFTVREVDPSLAVRTSIAQLMTAILSQRLWHKGGFKTRPYKLRDRDV